MIYSSKSNILLCNDDCKIACCKFSVTLPVPTRFSSTYTHKFLWCDDPPLHSLATHLPLPCHSLITLTKAPKAQSKEYTQPQMPKLPGKRGRGDMILRLLACLSSPPIPSHTLWTYLYTSELVTRTTRLAWTVSHVHQVQMLWSNTIQPVHTPCDFHVHACFLSTLPIPSPLLSHTATHWDSHMNLPVHFGAGMNGKSCVWNTKIYGVMIHQYIHAHSLAHPFSVDSLIIYNPYTTLATFTFICSLSSTLRIVVDMAGWRSVG